MKCKACDGRGVLVAAIYENDEVGFVDKTYQCCCCHGTGEIEQTNEEWFSSMYTEAKAEWLADHMKCSKCPQQNRCNGYHGGCVALMSEWLKQPHKE